MITPKPTKFLAVNMENVLLSDSSRRMRLSNTYKPRAWRWLNTKQASNKSLVKLIDKEEGFCFSPCSYTLPDITNPMLFDEVGEETGLVPQETCPMRCKCCWQLGPQPCFLQARVGSRYLST